MLFFKASLRLSPINGLGCFTDEPIPAGAVVWRFVPPWDMGVALADTDSLPDSFRAFLDRYGYQELQAGQYPAGIPAGAPVVVICCDHAKHMNHSAAPNLIGRGQYLDEFVAARDIAAGEELTCDYGSFDLDGPRKLADGIQ